LNPIIEKLINTTSNKLQDENKYIVDYRDHHDERQREFNIPFVLSILIQQHNVLEENLLKELQMYEHEIQIEQRNYDDWHNEGVIEILFVDPNPESNMLFDRYLPFTYKIKISCDERNWGYCECKPTDKGFNPIHDCCGHGCDWSAPEFRIVYEKGCVYARWDGDQSDYWRMQMEVDKQIGNANEIKENEKAEKLKESLKIQIADAQEKLRLLES
jgi:hypothetical protein